MIGVEAAGQGLETSRHAATLISADRGFYTGPSAIFFKTTMARSSWRTRSRQASIIRASVPSIAPSRTPDV